MTTYRERHLAGHHDADPDVREKAAEKEKARLEKAANAKSAKTKAFA